MEKTIVEMISGQAPKLIRDQFDRPSNVHGKTGPQYSLLLPVHYYCGVAS